MNNITGLDMKVTIQWYEANQDDFLNRLPAPQAFSLPFAVQGECQGFPKELIQALFDLLPQGAVRRSILSSIVFKPPAWFHNDSTPQAPRLTWNKEEALSSTAVIPSRVDCSRWNETGEPTADIWLFQIDRDACSREIQKIILAEGFIHELGHILVNPAFWIADYSIIFPDGEIVAGKEFLQRFVQAAEYLSPISHYSSFYRDENNKFVSKDGDIRVAVAEEVCESIAAFYLGFAFCGDDARGFDPFGDRSEVRKLIEGFLTAEPME